MILLTGAAGKTGQAILHALTKREADVRVLVRTPEQARFLSEIGAKESVIGDLRDKNALQKAVKDCESLYYICPNITPDEVNIGESLLKAAKNADVQHFVYHSVLHPHIEAMPHHWQKMRMEENIFKSGINFTILQPCAYMQNILSNWKSILDHAIYEIPYSTSSRISIVDLDDVAEAAALVLTTNQHSNAIYELAGPQPLSQDEVASIISTVLKINVSARTIERKTWAENTRKSALSENQIAILLMMFEYYENYGLVGNSFLLGQLLGRPATTFESFLSHHIPLIQQATSGGNK